MNQNILFSDNEYYNHDLQQVEFHAQCQGRLIHCVISWITLNALDQPNTPPATANERAALALFEAARFDIEDLAEALINQQAFNDNGSIELNHC
ncbi:DUF1488 domain-containing protein [Psychromonas sp. 14N.309.X.WAT.B.A12]|jgi:hypothetical protein|uniref:DUF1488 domain-containing protein n=1 Tax=Psychromonas sp. 14N.309.X.WAT.B.A12 TaxID=2998322 RepID=UPI0025AF10B5|nr:DUF1488 domain-containing protein [Psychromonas sp. 14N.309.X.WAT.B.A12]MDN2664772.1 DUF1488 domain-containing protein [Psychromonas sp. 14N.309.X.WAT.B.A12]